MILEYIKKEDDNYLTLRQVLNNEFHISYNLRVKLKKNKRIFVNDSNTYIDKVLNVGDVVKVFVDFEEDNSNIVATNMDLDILYEDDFLLVLNKPAGIPVHPSASHVYDTLSNGVKWYFDSKNLHRKIRIINRLDTNTSGVVIFAKNEYIHSLLSMQMQNNIFKKEYIAICDGIFENKIGTIDVPIARKENSVIERCVNSNGDNAITHYKVINEFKNYSELLINLETGRTHQIRVHMAYLGHPIIGDTLYGVSSDLINRQALHSYKVCFVHPLSKNNLCIIAPLPNDIKMLI